MAASWLDELSEPLTDQPKTPEWLSEMAVSADHVRERTLEDTFSGKPSLKQMLRQRKLERNVEAARQSIPANELGGIGVGVANTALNVAGSAAGLIGGEDAASQFFHRSEELSAAHAQNIKEADLSVAGVEIPGRRAVNEMTPGGVESVLTSAVFGPTGTLGVLGGIGLVTWQKAYNKARDLDLPPDVAARHANRITAAELGPEVIGGAVGNILPGAGGITRGFTNESLQKAAADSAKKTMLQKVGGHVASGLGEAGQELTTTMYQQTEEANTLPGRKGTADWVAPDGSVISSPMVEALRETLQQTGFQTTMTAGMQSMINKITNARQLTPAEMDAVRKYADDPSETRSRAQLKSLPKEIREQVASNSGEDRVKLAEKLKESLTESQPTAEVDPQWQQQIDEATAAADAKRAAQQQPDDEFSDEDRAFMAALRGEQAQPAVDASVVGDGAAQSELPVSAPFEQPDAAAPEVVEAPPVSEYKAKQLPNGNWEVRRKGRAAFISKLKVRQKAIEEARAVDAQRPTLAEEPIRDRTPARVQQGAWMRQTPTEPIRVGQPVAVGNETGFATKPPVTEEAVAPSVAVEQPKPSEPTGPVSSLLSEPVAPVEISKSKRKTSPPPATTEATVSAEKTPTVAVSTPPARQGSGPLNMAGESRATKPKKEKSPVPSFDSLPSASRDKFNSAFDSADVDGMNKLLDKSNRSLRSEFERRSGVTLPSTVKGTREAVATHFKGKAADVPAVDSLFEDDSSNVESKADFERKQQEIRDRRNELTAAKEKLQNELTSQKRVAARTKGKSASQKIADIEAEWTEAKERHQSEMNELAGESLKLQESHPYAKEQLRRRLESLKPNRDELDRRIADEQRQRDDRDWQVIVDRGGHEKVLSALESELRKAVGNTKRMSGKNKFRGESAERRIQRDIDRTNQLVAMFAKSSAPSPQVSAQPETTSPQPETKQVANVSQRGLPGLETEAEHLESIERMNLDTRANREALTAIGGARFAEDHSTPLRRLPVKALRQLEQDGALTPEQLSLLLEQPIPDNDDFDEEGYQEWLEAVSTDAVKGALSELKTVTYTFRGHSTTFSIGDRVRVNDEKGTITAFDMEDDNVLPELMMDGDKRPTSYSFDDIEHVDEAREARLAEEERLRDEADALRDEEENARYLESQKKPVEESPKMAPSNREQLDALIPILDKQVSKETSRHRQWIAAQGVIHGEAPEVMQGLLAHLQANHPDAWQYAVDNPSNMAIGLVTAMRTVKDSLASADDTKYGRTGPAADSDYIKEQIEGMQRTRAEIDKTVGYKRAAESDRDKKRKNSKDYKRLTEIIDTHTKTIGELEFNYELAKLEVDRSRIEDALVSSVGSDHFLSGMYELHTNTSRTHRRKADHAREVGGRYRDGEADYKIANDAQSEADVYANKIMNRAKSIALADGTLNNDEATGVSHEAFRDFAYWKPTSLEEFVAKLSLQQKAKRAGWKSEELDRVIGLTVDEAKAFKAEIAVAADGGADWVTAADAIIDRAKAVAKKVTDKQEADKKKADEDRAAEIKKLQDEKEARDREKKRKAAVEARYWNRLKERTKKADWEELTYQVRKGDDEKSSVTGETFGSATLGVHENKTIPTDAEGNVTGKPELSYTVTHLPSGWSIGTYKSKNDARSFAVMIEEAGLPWSEVREKDGITSEMAAKAGRHTKAFDNTDLDYLNDDERAEVFKTAQPSSDQVKADHVLDSTTVGTGKTPVKDITKKLKEFADAVPEFAFNPVFTVTEKGESAELTFDNKIGFKFNLTSNYFGTDASQFEVGDTVGIDLKDLGVTPITEQEMIVAKLKNVGFEVSVKGKAITAKWVLGTERQSFTVSKDTGSWSMEGKGVEGQFNGGRVITEANRFIEQVQQAGVDAANRMLEETGTGPLNPATGKELLAEANALVMKAGKRIARKAYDITGVLTDAETIRDITRIAAAYIKAGKVIFKEFVQEVMNSSPTFNRDVIKALGPNLVRAWNARRATNKLLNEANIEDLDPLLINAPQEPPEKAPPTDPIMAAPKRPDEARSYSIQEAMREADRRERGVDPLEDIPQESIDRWQYLANERMKSDGAAIKKLVNRLLSGNIEKMDNVDVMILQHRKVELQNEFKATQKALTDAVASGTDREIALAQIEADAVLEEYSQFDQATQRAGNVAGKTLRAFQVLMRDDYSLDTMVRRAVTKNAGHPLSKAQMEEVAELHKTIADLQEKLKTAMSEAAQKSSGDALEEAVGEMVASAPKKPTVARMNRPAKIQKKVDDAWSLFRRAVLGSASAKPEAEEIRTSANLNPEEAAADVVKAYREAGVSSLSEFMEELQDHPEAKNFQSAFESAWNAASDEDLKGSIDVNDPRSLSKAARALARDFIENGMRGAQNVSKAVYEEISRAFPGVTQREVNDAISGYGQFTPASQDEVDIEMSSLRGTLQSLSKTQDVEAKVPPKKTGQGRHEKSAEQRDQDRLLNAAMKEFGVKSAKTPGQLKSILDGIQTRLRNQIEDMDRAIRKNARIIREKGGTDYDPPTLKLIADRDAKKAEYEAHFGKEVKKLSAEKQAELAMKAAEKSLANWTERLESGQIEAKKKGSPPTNENLESVRAQRDAVRAEVEYMRKWYEYETSPKPTAEELEARQRELNQRATETRLRNQLADLLERKAKGELDPKKRRPPTPPTPAITELKKQVVAVKRDIAAAAEKVRLARRNNVEIAKDTFKALFLDSMYSVKLGFDASVLGVQGLKAIASHPRRILPKAVKAMARGWIQSLADADQVEFENRANFKNGAYDKMKLALGEKIDSVELHNINAKLPGLLQKGFKYPLAAIHASQRSAKAAMNVIRAEMADVLVEKTARRMLSNLRANAADMLIAGASFDGTLTDEQLLNIGRDVNSLTGHGHLGVFEQAATAASQVFLSPRWLKAKFDYVTLKTLRTATKTRTEGERQIVEADWEHRRMMVSEAYGRPIIAMAALAGLAYIAKSLAGGDDDEPFIDFDPRSPKFLSMNFGNDRYYDLTAGLAKTVGFIARVGFSTAKVAGYGPGSTKGVTYGENRNDTVLEIVWRYLLGQAAPSVRNIPNAAYSLATGKDLFSGKKVTPLGMAADQFLPMGPTAIAKMLHKSDNIPIGMTAAVFMALGANENLFEPRVKPWGDVNDYAADDVIRNWNRENPTATWAPGKLDDDYHVNKVKHTLTDKQFDEYVKLSGEYAKKQADQLLAKLSPSEIKRPSEKTLQALKHIVRQSRTSAKRKVVSKTGKMPDAE